MRLPNAILGVVLVSLVACVGAKDDDAAQRSCDANPEPSLAAAPATRAKVTGGLHSSGQNLNGQSLNGQNLNGQSLNGQNLNGQNLNGQSVNGLRLNGVQLNGQNLNGQNLNGQNLNGQNLNGQNLNGQNLNGQNLNGVALNELVVWRDGAWATGEALVGATIGGVLDDGRSVTLVVTAFERSADAKLAYYKLSYEGRSVCRDGERGLFVPGVWDEHAARQERRVVGEQTSDVTFSCESGVIAKCVTWGYEPFTVGAALHQTCTRMARADYCGSGVAFTKDHTMIDVFDDRGIQLPTSDASLQFEAAWGPDGAVCVHRPRFDARTAADSVALPSCWTSLPKCSSFEEARLRGATMGNASRPQSRLYCD